MVPAGCDSRLIVTSERARCDRRTAHVAVGEDDAFRLGDVHDLAADFDAARVADEDAAAAPGVDRRARRPTMPPSGRCR